MVLFERKFCALLPFLQELHPKPHHLLHEAVPCHVNSELADYRGARERHVEDQRMQAKGHANTVNVRCYNDDHSLVNVGQVSAKRELTLEAPRPW